MWRTTGRGVNSPQDLHVRQAYEAAKAHRAEVIDAATLIELELNEVLCDALAGAENERRLLLQTLVLTAEFCSFFQKWRMLRTLVNTGSAWWLRARTADASERLKRLKSVISFRNAFAHGEILVNLESLTCALRYFEGEQKTIELTSTFVSEVLGEAKSVFYWLVKLQQTSGLSSSEPA